jgi:hypothetical protein
MVLLIAVDNSASGWNELHDSSEDEETSSKLLG